MPLRELMGFCLGRLGWPPAAFWQATAHEVAAALEGAGASRRAAPGAARLRRLIEALPHRTASIRNERNG